VNQESWFCGICNETTTWNRAGRYKLAATDEREMQTGILVEMSVCMRCEAMRFRLSKRTEDPKE